MDRRDFMKISAAVAGAAALNPADAIARGGKNGSGKPSLPVNISNFKGVQIGAISYSWRAQGTTAGDMLLFALASGVGSVELMADPALTYTGGPAVEQKDWKSGTPEAEKCLARYKELGEAYRAAGVDIHMIKFNKMKENMPLEAVDFMFDACDAIGAEAVCVELNMEIARKFAPVAEKHGKYLAFHNHGQPSQENWQGFDPYLAFGRNIMLNFDAGHYFGFTGKNPCEIIEKYHDRIYTIHLKDKTSINNASQPNQNQIWGQGETPLRELLTLVSKHSGEPGWPVHCDIELEYPVPENSTSVAEVARCVNFCRNILK